jgi:hypothetical protein
MSRFSSIPNIIITYGSIGKTYKRHSAPKGCVPYCKSALSRGLFDVTHRRSKSVKRGMIPPGKWRIGKESGTVF